MRWKMEKREGVCKAEWSALVGLAVPIVLSELGWMAMSIVDTIMVGRIGPAAIGAVAVGNAVYYAPSLFGIGLLLGLDALVSQAYGRGDFDECHRWMAQGIYLAALVTPPTMAALTGIALALPKMGIQPEVAGPARSYLLTMMWGTLPLLAYAAARRYLQGVGQVKPITFVYISANLFNWGGNWLLIYGHWGLPSMGVTGSALSTAISRVYMAAALIFFAWLNERRRGHALFERWPGPRMDRLQAIAGRGLPAAGQIVLEVGAFSVGTLMAGRLAPAALAAHQIALNCASLTYMVPLGLSAAAAVSVGHAQGAGDGKKAARAGWMAIGLGAGFMSLAMLAFLLAPRPIIEVYTRDAAVLAIGPGLLALAGTFQIFDGIQSVSTGALRGLGDTRTAMAANLFAYGAVGLPLGAFLCFVRGWGVYGIWTGLTVALMVVAGVVVTVWKRRSGRLAAACSLTG